MANAAGASTRTAYDENLTDGVGLDALPAVASHLPDLDLDPTLMNGGAVAITDPTESTVYELYDGLGRVAMKIDALGQVTRTAYGEVVNGLVETTVTDALGQVTRGRVDGAGLLRQQIDALGKSFETAYDANGNQLSVRDPIGIGWDATYDARNRMLSRSDTRQSTPATTSWAYDADGHVVSETNALGQTETYDYDRRGRRTAVHDRLGGHSRFRYDAVSNLLQISDADNEARGGLANAAGTTQYRYDARNLLLGEASPAGQAGRMARTYTYDGGQRLTRRQVGLLAAGATPAFAGTPETTTYAYDAANRLVTRGYGSGDVDTFTYDSVGRVLTAASSRYRNRIERTYDLSGRLSSESLVLDEGALSGTTVTPAMYTMGYQYDAVHQTIGVTYPTGDAVTRRYTPRGQLAEIALGGSLVATRTYGDNGRLRTTTYGNGLIETRSDETGDDLLRSLDIPGVTSFTYAYDAAKRKTAQVDGIASNRNQGFGYDAASRLTSWNADSASQSWSLSLVGDWASFTRDGVSESRSHTAAHEISSITTGPTSVPLVHDLKGNVERDELGQVLGWDPENRLANAQIPADASSSGFGARAIYRYDALGRRIGKTVEHRTTLYLLSGARTVVEMDGSAVPTQSDISGETTDGTLANMALSPAGGGILPGAGITRVNFQPATTIHPAGYLVDTGKVFGVRTNGRSYGWSNDSTANAVTRHGAVPLTTFDTFVQAQPDGGSDAEWRMSLPNGTYPVILVCGDALSRDQTNDLTISGQDVTDKTPATTEIGYEAGNFDGYAVQATVTDGVLAITPRASAIRAKLCFIEIGASGQTIDQATRDRLASLIQKANAQTGNPPEPIAATRKFVHGSYVDEMLSYVAGTGADERRYFVHANHLYSAAALTDQSGQVVERYNYDAYGKQSISDGVSVIRSRSAFGFDRGFTGYTLDRETGLYYARSRIYAPSLGRFLSRDPSGYQDGLFLYGAYFVPNGLDSMGLANSWERAKGGLKVVGGSIEALVGGGLAGMGGLGTVTSAGIATPVTVPAAVAGGIFVAHGLDTVVAGMQQIWTGEPVETMFHNAVTAATGSPTAATLTETALGLSSGAAAFTKAGSSMLIPYPSMSQGYITRFGPGKNGYTEVAYEAPTFFGKPGINVNQVVIGRNQSPADMFFTGVHENVHAMTAMNHPWAYYWGQVPTNVWRPGQGLAAFYQEYAAYATEAQFGNSINILRGTLASMRKAGYYSGGTVHTGFQMWALYKDLAAAGLSYLTL